MIEPLIEGGGCILGLALLYYFQIWRPARDAARQRAGREPEPGPQSGQDRGRP